MKLNWWALSVGLVLLSVLGNGCRRTDPKKAQELVRAIQSGSVEEVRKALRDGADPNASLDQNVSNPTLFAIETQGISDGSRKDIVEALLAAGADPAKQQKDGFDALYVAARIGNRGLCERFIKLGLSPLHMAKAGVCALHLAAIRGDAACLTAMLGAVEKEEIDIPTMDKDHIESPFVRLQVGDISKPRSCFSTMELIRISKATMIAIHS